MSFSVSLFLALAVFLSIINMHLPTSSQKLSHLGAFLIFQMTIGLATIVVSAFQLRLHHRKSEREVGKFYKRIIRIERCLRCSFTNCSKSFRLEKVNGEATERDITEDFDDIDWNDVSSAIDFSCFWIILFFEIVAMTVIIMTRE